MTKISDDQIKLLDSFLCERISENNNKDIIKSFANSKGEQLVRYLFKRGLKEDMNGEAAFYIIKKDDFPYLFFSIKCGALFEPMNEQKIIEEEEKYNSFLESLKHNNDERPDQEKIRNYLENMRVSQNISYEQQVEVISQRRESAVKKRKFLKNDETLEKENPILRVRSTYPGVELMHFCNNDNAKDNWKKFGFEKPMGEVLFWFFISPLIVKIQNIVGCQYAFLFAADMSEDATLINYYNVSLHFERPKGIGTNKPQYDFCCSFLCQNINDMKSRQIEYFDTFNIDKTADLA